MAELAHAHHLFFSVFTRSFSLQFTQVKRPHTILCCTQTALNTFNGMESACYAITASARTIKENFRVPC